MRIVQMAGTSIALVLALAACDTSAPPPEPIGVTGDSVSSFASASSAHVADGRFIVVASPSAARAIERAGYDVTHALADGTVLLVTGPAGDAARLETIRGVQHATSDVVVTLDEHSVDGFTSGRSDGVDRLDESPTLWELQWEKPLIGVPEVHAQATGAGTRIAIIDTGIQPGHPDLGNLNEELSVAFIGGERIESDEPTDPFGHGTMVAGIAAAQGVGVLGTAPDAELVSIRVFGPDGGAFASDIFLALEYAAEIGADVANLSLGTVPLPPQANAGGIRGAEQRVVNGVVRQGTVVTVAAGNSATDLQHGGEWQIYTSIAGTIGASAIGADELLTFYSNYGTNAVHVAAPGGGMADPVDSYCGILEYFQEGRIVEPGEETQVCFLFPDEPFPVPVPPDMAVECVPCTAPERPFPLNGIISTVFDPISGEPGYAWEGGTSFAAPHVAGLVALVREVDPSLNPRRIAAVIAQGAGGHPGRGDPELGAGRIDALRTLELLQRGASRGR